MGSKKLCRGSAAKGIIPSGSLSTATRHSHSVAATSRRPNVDFLHKDGSRQWRICGAHRRLPALTLLLEPNVNHHLPTGVPHTRPAEMEPRTRKGKTREAKMSLLDDKIETLDRNVVVASSAKQVFESVKAALALARVSAPIPRPFPDPR